MTHRVVVTGVGLVCALGIGTEECWKNLLAGQSGVGLVTQFDTTGFDCKIAGEIKNFDPFRWIEKKELKKMGRFIQVALAGADFAVKSANWKPEDSDLDQVGVYVSSGIGGFDIIEREHWKLVQGGPGKISPFFIPSAIVNLASGHISIRYGAKGPNSATATACSASAHAIGDSFKIIERGAADMMISGGTEATITPMGIGGFAAMKALSTRNDDPAHASRPFDAGRDGFVMGEAGAIVVLEELEHARRRDAKIYAEVSGYGLSSDAKHITDPDPTGPVTAFKMALGDAGVGADEIDYINAHATSTPIGDSSETQMLKYALGEENAYKTPVSGTKGATGHCLGAAGAIEAMFTVLSIRDGKLPPTINYEVEDPTCDLDYVPNEAREADVKVAVSNSFGFGGHNACVVFERFED